MDKVLIVEDNPVLLKILQSGMKKYEDRFAALTARDGEEAIDILGKESISLLVTDLQMPKVDGLTLLAYMNDRHPEIPCVVMSAHGTPQIKEKISQDVLQFIEKPFEIDELVETILPALQGDEPVGTLNGISIANFLQMIHMEQKTCLLEIETPDERKGYFYFEEGVLFDAVYEELNGEEAALAIIPHERAKIRFKNLAKGKKKVSRRIDKDLMALLMDAMRLKDEAEAEKWGGSAGEVDQHSLFPEENGLFGETEAGEEDDVDAEFDLLEFDDRDLDDDAALSEPPAPAAPEPAEEIALEPVEGTAPEPVEEIVPEPAFAAAPPPVKEPAPPAPEEISPPPSPAGREGSSDVTAMLTGLRGISGYRGAAVLDDSGEVVVQDAPERDVDLELFAAMALDLIRTSRKVGAETGLGAYRELILATDRGVLLCLSPEPGAGESIHGMILLGPGGNRAMAKISLKKILPALVAALA